jgi:hypothetical protein
VHVIKNKAHYHVEFIYFFQTADACMVMRIYTTPKIFVSSDRRVKILKSPYSIYFLTLLNAPFISTDAIVSFNSFNKRSRQRIAKDDFYTDMVGG